MRGKTFNRFTVQLLMRQTRLQLANFNPGSFNPGSFGCLHVRALLTVPSITSVIRGKDALGSVAYVRIENKLG